MLPSGPGTTSLSQRPLLLVLVVGFLVTVFYLSSFLGITGIPSGRTFQGRFLGIVGFFLILGLLFQSPKRGLAIKSLEASVDSWHVLLGSLSVWIILLHASFRFFNGIAALAFMFLVAVCVSGATVRFFARKQGRMGEAYSREKPFGEISDAPQIRTNCSIQRWLHIHFVLSVGLLAFSLVHILSILYY